MLEVKKNFFFRQGQHTKTKTQPQETILCGNCQSIFKYFPGDLLSHKCCYHRLCMYGFRISEYTKIRLVLVHVPETLVVKMTSKLITDVFSFAKW